MKANNLKLIKEVEFTHSLLNDHAFFFICYLTISPFKYLKVTVPFLLFSQYLFFDKKMSLMIFEKWTTYVCFLKKFKNCKTSTPDCEKGREREGPTKGERKMKH